LLNYAVIGHNSDHDCTHVIVSEARPLRECLKEIQAKALYDQQINPPNLCCREVNNLTLEMRKSHPARKNVDILIFHCQCCGDYHRRFYLDTGKYGAAAEERKVVMIEGERNV